MEIERDKLSADRLALLDEERKRQHEIALLQLEQMKLEMEMKVACEKEMLFGNSTIRFGVDKVGVGCPNCKVLNLPDEEDIEKAKDDPASDAIWVTDWKCVKCKKKLPGLWLKPMKFGQLASKP